MDIITVILMLVTLAACGLGVWCEVSARRAARAAAAVLEAAKKDAMVSGWDGGWDAGVTWLRDSWAKRMGERAMSSKNGVTISAELVGGIADGCEVVVGKDQDFVWMQVAGLDVVYLFAHRSRNGRWIYQHAEMGNVKWGMEKQKVESRKQK